MDDFTILLVDDERPQGEILSGHLRKHRYTVLESSLFKYAREHGRKRLSYSKEARDLLLRYEYPGNVRELQNIVQRAEILSRRDIITVDDLPRSLRQQPCESGLTHADTSSTLPARIEQIEEEMILDALRAHSGNQSQAARQLGISERNLRCRLKKWRIKPPM